MDITPIFRPPTPPKAGFFFFTLLFLSFSGFAKEATQPENTNVPFLLFYQPLFEMNPNDAHNYVKKVQNLFVTHQQDSVEQVVIERPTPEACVKKKLSACSEALYFHSRCVPKQQPPTVYCKGTAKTVSRNYFKESTFNRIKWNKFAVGVNYFCNKNPAKVCPELAKLHDQYMKSYLQMMAQRRKAKEKAKAPFAKKMKNKKNQ